MKKLLAILFLIICLPSLKAADSLKYTMIENCFHLTTYYEMVRKESYEGRVVENMLHARTHFDLYDAEGNYEGQGICRALSLGVIFPWARVIDVYDSHKNKIGVIDGKTFTTASAKFNFYDAQDKLVAIAYYGHEGVGFTLVDSSSNERTLGYLKRKEMGKKVKEWDVALYDRHSVDERLLKIFSAFAVKKQDSF